MYCSFEVADMSEESIRPSDDQERVSRLSSDAASDETVREYERRYSGERPEPKIKRKEMPRSYSTLRVSEDEKLWAAVAHGSVWVTLIGGLISAGTIVPLSIFIPLI